MKIALTGASGFVGLALQSRYPQNVIIDRHDDETAILQKLEGVDVVINLAGAPIIKRWSDPYKKVLLNSRIETTKHLVRAVNKSSVTHFISTSAIGIYPDDCQCDEECKELADDFLGRLAQQWEAEAKQCSKPTTILRFGVVLGKEGGALKQMLTPFRLGLGGIIDSGTMMTSWIAIDDLLSIYDFIINKQEEGTFNAVAPHPVSNYHLTKALGTVLRRPTVLPIPEFVLRLMYGEAATVLTASKEIYPKALEEAGFVFKYREIESALQAIVQ
ncbi:MAG: TIGR01777 family oxidoreductase [Sulfurimonadaceae bacterium]